MQEAESLEASIREQKAKKKLEDAEARAEAHKTEVEVKVGEIQAMHTSHSTRLFELEAEAAEKLQRVTKANDARLLKGTINRILRHQLASGWNKWVDSYHAERLAAGLSAQSDAHKEALEAQELQATAKLEEALAAHEVGETRPNDRFVAAGCDAMILLLYPA